VARAHKALRQVLAYAVRAKLISENAARSVQNGRSLPILVVGTCLRPGEWLALERRYVDTKAGVLPFGARLHRRARKAARTSLAVLLHRSEEQLHQGEVSAHAGFLADSRERRTW
jgi:hypothetical protein